MKHDTHLNPALAADIPATSVPQLRNESGQFAGIAPVPWLHPAPVTPFSTPDQVTEKIDHAVTAILSGAVTHDPEGDEPAPVVALAPSPGSGKTTRTQKILAQQPRDILGKDAFFLMPTSDLSGEACARARQMAISGNATPAFQMLGRSALNPTQPEERMCLKWKLAERVSRSGLRVRETLCEAVDTGDNEPARCPHFDTCAYLQQFRCLPEEPVDRYAAHAFAHLPDPTQRPEGLRVIDEKFWPSMLKTTVVPAAAFETERRFPEPANPDDGEISLQFQRVLEAAAAVLGALRSERSLLDLPYTSTDYRRFAREELSAAEDPPAITPDMPATAQEQRVEQMLASRSNAHRYARIWEALAQAHEQSRHRPDRVELRHSIYWDSDKASKVEVEEIVVHGIKDMISNPPTLVLDADASETILRVFFPDIDVHHATLEPNAEIIQVSSHRMSTTALLNSPSLRDRCRRMIEAEVERDQKDHAAGVLIGCTKKVARQFFLDAGLLNGDESSEEEVRIMLDTQLLGASWLWFGDRALGSNRYESYSTVIVLGRNEIPLDALEGQGRSLFGDRDGEEPLCFVEPDEHGRRLMPEFMVPYEIRSAEPVAVPVRLHPDPRIREIQRQHRECATRQLIERLRLGRASYRKRVILACNIPIPSLPVDRLVTFAEIAGDVPRLQQALEETATCHRTLILTGKQMPAHAGKTFKSEKAAQDWLGRTRKNPRTAMDVLNNGVRGFSIFAAHIRRQQPRAQLEVCIVLVSEGECPREVIEAAHGPLREYRPVDLTEERVFGKPRA
ncbi:hypothetical protein SAMN05421688_3248 [Poseidonocella pacifica]|uniref:Uncharacterized protein n=1 Tax=Poseidonocella pacifica TaxID=871651 RepID=A0A1I0YPL7_9RHOB|nr:hypothetical protein [Poseidonocella pacifica]SFB14897.1 hypothetical protein SAMN05421688_3248 [Poseidonocella pacifica]